MTESINLFECPRPEPLTARLERYAVMLWQSIQAGQSFGPQCERERLLEAAYAMHAVRMVTVGRARDTASTLYDLAWSRIDRIDARLRADLRAAAERARELNGGSRHVA